MAAPLAEVSFLDFLATQPPARVDALFTASSHACAALLRALPPLARLLVLRLLHVDAALPETELGSWAQAEAAANQAAAVAALRRLRVLLPERGAGGEVLRLHPALAVHLRAAVHELEPEGSPAAPPEVVALLPSPAALAAHAAARWEALLLFLVGSGPPPARVSDSTLDIPELLHGAGLLATPAEAAEAAATAAAAGDGFSPPLEAAASAAAAAGGVAITPAGFRFLLLERSSQLWQLLQRYMAQQEAAAGPAAVAALLACLLRLAFLPPHAAQPAGSLGAAERGMLADLAALGVLLLVGPNEAPWFCPTPLAAALAAGLTTGGAGAARAGHLIVETNYRVYAYTASPLDLAILRLFVRPEYRLPNLAVGALTRDSVAAALTCGLGAEQLVAYLQAHAHPHVALRTPAVPETVTDQIRLWARDTARLRVAEATLYDDFPSAEAFRAAVAHARAEHALLWSAPERRVFVARRAAQPSMREHFRRMREAGTLA